jgi:hypothetical protein
MMAKASSMKTLLVTTMILQMFNGLSALFGGFGLMGDPSGKALQMETAWLKGTPFPDFLIPGIFLFVVNGLGNVTGFFLSLKKYRYAGHIAAAFGAIMVVWILSQVAWIGYRSFLQPLYFFTGLVQLAAGWYLMREMIRSRRPAV